MAWKKKYDSSAEKKSPMERMTENRENITEKFIEAIKQSDGNWSKPWRTIVGSAIEGPRNAVTGEYYRGGNVLALLMAAPRGNPDPRWVTYKQAQEKGWQVRKGEKHTKIEFFDFKMGEKKEIKDDTTGEEKTVREKTKIIYKQYQVFHASQVEGMPAYVPVERPEFEKIETGERILQDSGVPITHGGDRAFYSPASDSIRMPLKEAFRDPVHYYGTALHEVGHSTGHESRLKRDFSGVKGDQRYAREELVAEMASLFVQLETGISLDEKHYQNHAEYCANWHSVLKDDPNELFRAASAAQKAADYMMRLERQRKIENENENTRQEQPGEKPERTPHRAEKSNEDTLSAEAASKVYLAEPESNEAFLRFNIKDIKAAILELEKRKEGADDPIVAMKNAKKAKLYLARPGGKYAGEILHSEHQFSVMKVGESYLVHKHGALNESPKVGDKAIIEYDEKGWGTVDVLEFLKKKAEPPLHESRLKSEVREVIREKFPALDAKSFNIYTEPNPGTYKGAIFHVNDRHCAQMIGQKSVVVHRLEDLERSPKLYEFAKIRRMSNGKAKVTDETQEKKKTLTR